MALSEDVLAFAAIAFGVSLGVVFNRAWTANTAMISGPLASMLAFVASSAGNEKLLTLGVGAATFGLLLIRKHMT